MFEALIGRGPVTDSSVLLISSSKAIPSMQLLVDSNHEHADRQTRSKVLYFTCLYSGATWSTNGA